MKAFHSNILEAKIDVLSSLVLKFYFSALLIDNYDPSFQILKNFLVTFARQLCFHVGKTNPVENEVDQAVVSRVSPHLVDESEE